MGNCTNYEIENTKFYRFRNQYEKNRKFLFSVNLRSANLTTPIMV